MAIVMLIVGTWRGLTAVTLQSGVDDVDHERPFEVVKRERDGSSVGDVRREDTACLLNTSDAADDLTGVIFAVAVAMLKIKY